VLAGRVAIVTGASAGIGEATARALAVAGMRVAVCARRRERLDRLAAGILSAGGEVAVYGLDVTYATDLTVQENPGYLLRHKVLLSLGHDECWSLAERQAAVTAYDHGANVVFFAASPVLRHVRSQPSPFGPDRELVDYRDSGADPLDGRGEPRQVTGNEWANPPSSWPEYDFVGDTYAGFLEPGLHDTITALVKGVEASWAQ